MLLYFLGYFTTGSDPSSFPVGKSNASFRCFFHMFEDGFYKEIAIAIRQNKNEKFISVLKCNESGTHRLNNETKFEGVNILPFRDNTCVFRYYWMSHLELTVSLQSDKCILGSQTSASWRCLFSNGTNTFNSSEKNIYSIEGIYHFDIL